MPVLPFVVAILLNNLLFVNCGVLNDHEMNYLSKHQEYISPITEEDSVDDFEMDESENEDEIVEQIINEFMRQFSNLHLSEQFKNALINDYFLGKRYTRGDVSICFDVP